MRKIVLSFLVLISVCTNAAAEEITIQLRSGNTMTIQYTGSIDKVTLNGETDAIVGINMKSSALKEPVQKSQQAPPKESRAVEKESRAAEAAAGPDKSGGGKWLQLKWADPQQED